MKYYDIATEKRAEFDIAMASFTKRMVKYFCCLLFCSILQHGVRILTRQTICRKVANSMKAIRTSTSTRNSMDETATIGYNVQLCRCQLFQLCICICIICIFSCAVNSSRLVLGVIIVEYLVFNLSFLTLHAQLILLFVQICFSLLSHHHLLSIYLHRVNIN